LLWIDFHNFWLRADLIVGVTSFLVVVLLSKKLLQVDSLRSRLILFLILVLAHVADGITFVETIRTEPYYFLKYSYTVVTSTVIFYVAATLAMIFLLLALRNGFTFESVSSFAFPGSFILIFLKIAFSLAYASPVGGILTGLSFVVTAIQTILIKKTKRLVKSKED
jgi:hypothetical protein